MSEAKEFDEAIKPTIKQIKQSTESETFNPPKEKEKPKETEWEKFFKHENEKYGEKVRQVGQKNTYTIPIDGKDTTFTRKRPTVAELRLIAAKQKEYDEKPNKELSLFEAQELASLYLEFAQMLLINNDTGKAMSKDEFEQQDWGFIRSIVDNCLLKSLVGSSG